MWPRSGAQTNPRKSDLDGDGVLAEQVSALVNAKVEAKFKVFMAALEGTGVCQQAEGPSTGFTESLAAQGCHLDGWDSLPQKTLLPRSSGWALIL